MGLPPPPLLEKVYILNFFFFEGFPNLLIRILNMNSLNYLLNIQPASGLTFNLHTDCTQTHCNHTRHHQTYRFHLLRIAPMIHQKNLHCCQKNLHLMAPFPPLETGKGDVPTDLTLSVDNFLSCEWLFLYIR